MALGDTLAVLTPQLVDGPSSDFAPFDTVEDASTPPITVSVRDFGGAADSHVDFKFKIPSTYSGATGFTWSYSGATDGTDLDIIEMELRVLPIVDGDVLTADLGMDTQTASAIQDTPVATSTNKFMESATGTLTKASFASESSWAVIASWAA